MFLTYSAIASFLHSCNNCASGEWNGSINYWSAGVILNFGKFSGTLTCKGEPEKKMYVAGLVVGSGFFAGWTGNNTLQHYTMFGNSPSDIEGTTQGGVFSLGAGWGPIGIAGVDFPMNSTSTGGKFDIPSFNFLGIDYPSVGGSSPFKPKLSGKGAAGIGFNMSGHRVDEARCE
jgi:hypothetical protein